jgi:hypothetical protein
MITVVVAEKELPKTLPVILPEGFLLDDAE